MPPRGHRRKSKLAHFHALKLHLMLQAKQTSKAASEVQELVASIDVLKSSDVHHTKLISQYDHSRRGTALQPVC